MPVGRTFQRDRGKKGGRVNRIQSKQNFYTRTASIQGDLKVISLLQIVLLVMMTMGGKINAPR